jgi:magnesium transporter
LRSFIEPPTYEEYEETVLLQETLLASQKKLDESTWTIEDSPERRFRRLKDLIDAKKAIRNKELSSHDKKSASRLMTSDFFAFPLDMTIREATRCIRDNPNIDFLKGIFILNAAGHLQGYVPARSMMIYPGTTELHQIMRPVLHKVIAEASREEVIDLVERYKIFFLPVIDTDQTLLGVIAYADIVEALEELTDETFAHMAGTNENFTTQDSVFQRFSSRAPWLIVTIFAGLINVAVMASFQKHEEGILRFAICFVPLITGLSGNIGLQCSTVLIRIMALGGLTIATRRETISKELLSGFFTGTFFGITCGALVYFIDLLVGGNLTTSSPTTVAVQLEPCLALYPPSSSLALEWTPPSLQALSLVLSTTFYRWSSTSSSPTP